MVDEEFGKGRRNREVGEGWQYCVKGVVLPVEITWK